MSAYCTVARVWGWIPRGSVQNPARLVADVATDSEVLTLDGHGLETGSAVTFRAEAGGSLPSPLAAGTTYYAIRITDATFQVSATAGGAAVNLTTAGENVVMVVELPWDDWIAEASNEIECTLPAHVVPLESVPEVVEAYCAGLVAEKALAACGVGGPPGFVERLARVRDSFRDWRRGIPLRGSVVPASANLAVRSTITGADPRGWTPADGNGVLP